MTPKFIPKVEIKNEESGDMNVCNSTCDQGLIRHGASLDHFPVHRELSSWGDFDDVAPLDQLHHHLLLAKTRTLV